MLNYGDKVDPDQIRSSLFLCVRSVRYMTEQLVTIVASLNEGVGKEKNRITACNRFPGLESDKTSCEDITTESVCSISSVDVAETFSKINNNIPKKYYTNKLVGSDDNSKMYNTMPQEANHLNNSKSAESMIDASSQTHLRDIQDKVCFTTPDKYTQTFLERIGNEYKQFVKGNFNYDKKAVQLTHLIRQNERFLKLKSESRYPQYSPSNKIINFPNKTSSNQNVSDLSMNKKIRLEESPRSKLKSLKENNIGDIRQETAIQQVISINNKSPKIISHQVDKYMNNHQYNKEDSQVILNFNDYNTKKPPDTLLTHKNNFKDERGSFTNTKKQTYPIKTFNLSKDKTLNNFDRDNPIIQNKSDFDWKFSYYQKEERLKGDQPRPSLYSIPNAQGDLENTNIIYENKIFPSNYINDNKELSFYDDPVSDSDLLSTISGSQQLVGNVISISDLSIYNSNVSCDKGSELICISRSDENKSPSNITFPTPLNKFKNVLPNELINSVHKIDQQESWTNKLLANSLSNENLFRFENKDYSVQSEYIEKTKSRKASTHFSRTNKMKYKTINTTNIINTCFFPPSNDSSSNKDTNTLSVKSLSASENNKFTQIFVEKSESQMIDLDVLVSQDNNVSYQNTSNNVTYKQEMDEYPRKPFCKVSRSENYLNQIIDNIEIAKTRERLLNKENFNINNNFTQLKLEHKGNNLIDLNGQTLPQNQILTTCVEDCSIVEDPLITNRTDQPKGIYGYINESLSYEVLSAGQETIPSKSQLISTTESHWPRHVESIENVSNSNSKSETIFVEATLEMTEGTSKLSNSRKFKIRIDPIHLYLEPHNDENKKNELNIENQNDLLSCFEDSNKFVENQKINTPKTHKRKKRKRNKESKKQLSHNNVNTTLETTKSQSKSIIECFLDNL